MADYIFKVYLHTDKVKLPNGDVPPSEYTFILPSFYFTLNEYVSAKATINIPDSFLSCRGGNTYNALAVIGGLGSENCYVHVTTNNIADMVTALMNSKALAQAGKVQYSVGNSYAGMETAVQVSKT